MHNAELSGEATKLTRGAPGTKREERDPSAPHSRARRSTAPFRVYSPSFSIPQHTGARLGLEQVDGVDPSQLRWVTHYLDLASGCPGSGYSVTLPYISHGTDPSTACREAIPDARLLGLLNACFVVAEYPVLAPGLVLESRRPGSITIETSAVYHAPLC